MKLVDLGLVVSSNKVCYNKLIRRKKKEEEGMTILDIFSWLPAKELSLEDIESIALEIYKTHEIIDGYALVMELPEDANENVVSASEELINENKRVCYLLRDGSIIAAIGYR